MNLKKISWFLLLIILAFFLFSLHIMKEATEKSIKEEKAVLEEIIEIPVEVEQIAIFTGNPERVQSQINRWLLENHDRIEITERVQSPYWINQSGIVVSIFFKTKK